MAMKKLVDKSIRKITRAGKASLSVTIPIEIIKELGWREKQRVRVKRIRGGVEIKDWRKG
jgi:bifunctional DNA-binding transcriptional regulator/antitoxin component of YhaV-PrlF toxin-antitoxin module